MNYRFDNKEDLEKILPQLIDDAKGCLKFVTDESFGLPVFIPMSNFYDDAKPTPLGTMNVKVIPVFFKPMISTGDWVPILQIKLVITDLNIEPQFQDLFNYLSPKKMKTDKLAYTFFLSTILDKIKPFMSYCNLRNVSFNIYEIEWED